MLVHEYFKEIITTIFFKENGCDFFIIVLYNGFYFSSFFIFNENNTQQVSAAQKSEIGSAIITASGFGLMNVGRINTSGISKIILRKTAMNIETLA